MRRSFPSSLPTLPGLASTIWVGFTRLHTTTPSKQCCGLLSVFGIFFLFSVANMFATQPMFTDVEVWQEHHDHDAAVNCYIGGAIYVATLAVSAAYFCPATRRSKPFPVPLVYGNISATILRACMLRELTASSYRYRSLRGIKLEIHTRHLTHATRCNTCM